jgi:hypothetical protein
MRIVCYFPICPHQVSSDKPRWNTKKTKNKRKRKREGSTSWDRETILLRRREVYTSMQAKRKPKAEENQLYHSELIIDIMLILVGGSPSL